MRTIVKVLAILFLFAHQVPAAEDPTKDAAKELVEAAAKGDTARVAVLLDKGADVNEQGDSGTTPIMFAARWKTTQAAKYLLSRGADPNLKAKNGQTALAAAVYGSEGLDMVCPSAG